MKKFVIMTMVTVMTAAAAVVFTGCGAGGKDIGKEAALEAALNDAGVSESDTTRLRVSSERDDGRKVYEVRFDVEGTEYDYEISGTDGQILSVDTERISGGNEGADAAVNSGAEQGRPECGSTKRKRSKQRQRRCGNTKWCGYNRHQYRRGD